VTVENALYTDPALVEAAAVGIPDFRLGELVAAVVTLKPEFRGKLDEKALIATASKRFAFL
jgi:acyl-CoA synthetase (AMP-forming)/AMP-acid ligase II